MQEGVYRGGDHEAPRMGVNFMRNVRIEGLNIFSQNLDFTFFMAKFLGQKIKKNRHWHLIGAKFGQK